MPAGYCPRGLRPMLLHQDSNGGGTLLADHVTDFASTRTAWRWRRSAQRRLPATPGLVFAKALPFIGSGASAGFGGGVPALGRQVLLTAWRGEADFDRFLEQPVAQHLLAPEAGSCGRCSMSPRHAVRITGPCLCRVAPQSPTPHSPPSPWGGFDCDRCRAFLREDRVLNFGEHAATLGRGVARVVRAFEKFRRGIATKARRSAGVGIAG